MLWTVGASLQPRSLVFSACLRQSERKRSVGRFWVVAPGEEESITMRLWLKMLREHSLFLLVSLFCFFVFRDRVSLYNSPDWPGTLFVDQGGLKLGKNLPTSAYRVLGVVRMRATTTQTHSLIFKSNICLVEKGRCQIGYPIYFLNARNTLSFPDTLFAPLFFISYRF